MKPSSIAAINLLPDTEKFDIYTRFIPEELLHRFDLTTDFIDSDGRPLLQIRGRPGATDVVLVMRHQHNAVDPLLYVHLTDTINGQIHVLLYIVNDPDSERFDVDRMPDGTKTEFGVICRNIDAEIEALKAGLAPGQVRRGLRLVGHSVPAFENFITSLNHDLYFVEPLYYHIAIILERYGFAYQRGLNFMQEINSGFRPGGKLEIRLDGSTPFKVPDASSSIRGRSWAIHDGILDAYFTDVTMYKKVGRLSNTSTYPNAKW